MIASCSLLVEFLDLIVQLLHFRIGRLEQRELLLILGREFGAQLSILLDRFAFENLLKAEAVGRLRLLPQKLPFDAFVPASFSFVLIASRSMPARLFLSSRLMMPFCSAYLTNWRSESSSRTRNCCSLSSRNFRA